MRSIVISFVAVAALSTSATTAQTARPASDAQTIGRGWTALAAGRVTEAASLADSVLKKKPRSHAAFTLKLEALSAGPQPLTALDVYEAWIPKAGRNVDDRGLLQPVAAGLLRVLSADQDLLVRTTALEFLAQLGDNDAVDALRKRGAEGEQPALVALIERGDPAAIASMQALLASPTGRDMSPAIAALAEHGGLTSSLIETLAKDRVPMNRAAIVSALVRSKEPNAVRLLESLSQDPDPLVHSSLVLARAKNGEEAALADARAMLASEVPDIRLTAAEALFASLPRESEQAVRPLLTDRDGINRFRAAAIVGKSDPAAIQSVLLEGLADPNPLIQREAARIATETVPDDIVRLRQLLRHSDRLVVAQAAGAIALN